jgi:hypothetical protein
VPKLLIRGEYFESVAPGALFEADYERLLMANAAYLYPQFHLVKFKCDVQSEFGGARADLALIHRTYRSWWVVEVELGAHPLQHVEPQVRILSFASYGLDEANYLATHGPGLNVENLRQMMRGAQPRVLVLVDEYKPSWDLPLKRLNALVGIVEVFRSPRGVEVLRVNGDHPSDEADAISICRVDPNLTRSLVVDSPAALGYADGATLTILYGDGTTQWRVVGSRDMVWLMPVRRWPLPTSVFEYTLVKTESGALRLLDYANRGLR